MAEKETYRVYTIGEAIGKLQAIASELPNGYKSKFTTGDFEGNYCHQMHEFQIDRENGCVFVGYEMHEGDGW